MREPKEIDRSGAQKKKKERGHQRACNVKATEHVLRLQIAEDSNNNAESFRFHRMQERDVMLGSQSRWESSTTLIIALVKGPIS